MNQDITLLELLNCTKITDDKYSGESIETSWGHVFGGQVLAQSIRCARDTVAEDREVHSAHAYFLRAGDLNQPISFEVIRSRDGKSYSSRRVVASQNGLEIFHMSTSFQVSTPSLEFYDSLDMPKGVPADDAPKSHDFLPDFFDAYVLGPENRTSPDALQIWFKAKQPLPADQSFQRAALAYISDMGILSASFVSTVDGYINNITKTHSDHMMATLDHAIWFHRPCDLNDWFLYDCRPESTGDGRGFCRGRIYSKDGVLVASSTQEGVLRKKKARVSG